MSEKSAAVLTIKDAKTMTPEGRQHIATWIRRQANLLLKHGDEYSRTYQARYLYKDDDDGNGQENTSAPDAGRAERLG